MGEDSRNTRADWAWRIAPLVIAVLSLALSGFEFYDNHQRNVAMDTPRVDVEQNTDTDDSTVGVEILNRGIGPATIKNLTFYIDRKPGDADDVIDQGKFVDVGTYEFNDGDTMAAGETQWLIKMSTKNKKELTRFIDFIDKHVAVEFEACSITTKKCESKCSADGWCK